MIILLSPTKQMTGSLDSGVKIPFPLTEPVFNRQAKAIVSSLNNLTLDNLGKLMKTKENLTLQTREMLNRFMDENQPRVPALFAYTGTVFRELAPESLSQETLDYGRKHLRILSAAYGILQPFDGIRPYRLEAKAPLALPPHRNLYSFWKESLNDYLEKELLLYQGGPVLNLASQEYTRMLDRKKLSSPVITLHFKEQTPSGVKTKGMYAKMARGRALRIILSQRMEDPEVLKSCDLAGYRFSGELSNAEDWVFLRESVLA